MEKLIAIQQELKAPKSQYNKFGGYHYRSLEDITEAVKPLCVKHKVLITLSDEIVVIEGRYYVKATAKYTDGGFTTESYGFAREEEMKKGMDGSQVTGSSSSYARKYAMNGLLMIDDAKDADTNEQAAQTQQAQVQKKEAAKPQPQPKKETAPVSDDLAMALSDIKRCKTNDELNSTITNYKHLFGNARFIEAGKAKRSEINAGTVAKTK